MKRNLLISVCIVHTFIKVHSEETVLNSAMLKQYVFANATKERYKYIAKHLQINLGKKHLNIKEIYFFLATDKIDQITNNRIVSKNKSLTKEITIVYPLGLVIRAREEHQCHSPSILTRHDPSKEDKIIFLLDKKLRLNIKFHHIHFGFMHLHTCSVGEVRVISHSKNKQIFRYCGIHSNMINYPQNRKVTMFVPTFDMNLRERTGIFNVTALYYVIDIKRVVTFQKYKPFWKNLMWYLYLVPKDIRVMKFALRTKKYQYFIIKFTNDSGLIVELFDGPGTYSPNIFKKRYEMYVTSTFQSIIYLWITSIKINQNCGFTFLTDSSSVKMNIQVNDSLQYITSHAFQKYEVFKIFSYYNVNLTVINLTCTGFNDPLCTFAGITAYGLNNDSYTDIQLNVILLIIFLHPGMFTPSQMKLC